MRISTISALLLLFGAVMSPPAAIAQPTQSCDQCKLRNCLMRHVKFHEFATAFYTDMKARFVQEWGSTDLTVDFTAIPEAKRPELWTKVNQAGVRMDDEWKKVEASAPSRAEGCHVPDPKVTAITDCTKTPHVDQTSLEGAVRESPCQQIGNLIRDHENHHSQWCDALPKKTMPFKNAQGDIEQRQAIRHTPAGEAQEEIDAHAINIAGLQQLIREIDKSKRCKTSFSDVSLVCTFGGTMRTEEHLSGYVCGDPLAEQWQLTKFLVTAGRAGPKQNLPTDAVLWDGDQDKSRIEMFRNARHGNIAGVQFPAGASAGGMSMAYRDDPRPSMIIRYFSPTWCKDPAEQILPLAIEVSEGCRP